MLFNISYILELRVSTGNEIWVLCLFMLSCITMGPMMPRFIISVRELYERDLCRRWQGVDTGFGVLSQHITSQTTSVSVMAFADVASVQDLVVEGDAIEPEVIRLEPLGDNTHDT